MSIEENDVKLAAKLIAISQNRGIKSMSIGDFKIEYHDEYEIAADVEKAEEAIDDIDIESDKFDADYLINNPPKPMF